MNDHSNHEAIETGEPCTMCMGTGKFNDFEVDPVTNCVTDLIITCPSCRGTGRKIVYRERDKNDHDLPDILEFTN